MPQTDPETRMKGYLKKIAAGPRLSKDLTEEEAEDALASVSYTHLTLPTICSV